MFKTTTTNSTHSVSDRSEQNSTNLTKHNQTNTNSVDYNVNSLKGNDTVLKEETLLKVDSEKFEDFGRIMSGFCDYFMQSPDMLAKFSGFSESSGDKVCKKESTIEDDEETHVEYRTRSEIANLTDDEIMTAVYQVCMKEGFSEDQMFIVFNNLVSDDYSFLGEVINTAKTQLESDNFVEEGKKFIYRGDFSTSEKMFLSEQYPEVSLQIKRGRKHEHGVAAAARAMDTYLLKRKTDMAAPCLDVGGNPLAYVTKGVSNVHCCCPCLDVKDKERLQKRDEFVSVERRNIKKQKEACLIAGGKESLSRLQALEEKDEVCKRFLRRPQDFFCNNEAQDCDHQALYGLSVHAAYDIPMEDWPLIMIQHGLQIVHGCILYHSDIHIYDEGEFPEMNMYYKKTNEGGIEFGFKNTMTPLYSHNCEEYLRYGHTQTIRYGRYLFLYEVVKYRKYSLDFEITLISTEAEVVKPLLEGVLIPSAFKGLVKVTSLQYSGEGDYESQYSYVPCETYVDYPGWKRLMDYCLSSGDGLTFDKVKHFTRSLTQRIIVNRVKISDGERLNSDNAAIVATAAYAITIRMRYEGEDLVSKFRGDVERQRNSKKSFLNLFNGKTYIDFFSKIKGDWIDVPISEWKSSLISKYWDDGLPEFFEMFDYEVVDWEDIEVEDLSLSMEECDRLIARADETCAAYADSLLFLPNVEAGSFDALSAPEKAFIEAREALIEMGDMEALKELEAMSHAYFRAEALSLPAEVDQSYIDGGDPLTSDEKKRRKANDSCAGSYVCDDTNTESDVPSISSYPYSQVFRQDEPGSDSSVTKVDEKYDSSDSEDKKEKEFEAEVVDDRDVTEVQLKESERYRNALEEDRYNDSLAEVVSSDAQIVSNMLMGECYDLPAKVPYDMSVSCEFMGNSEDIIENENAEKTISGETLKSVKNQPFLKYGPPKESSMVDIKNYWRAAMREFQTMSAVQEEKKRDLASDHVLKYLEWVPEKNSNTGVNLKKPTIPPNILALHGVQFEPNLLKFIDGICVAPTVNYSKIEIFNTSEDWMYGIDVTSYDEVFNGKPKFVKIYRKKVDGDFVWFIKDHDRRHRKIVRLYVEESLSVVLGMRFASAAQAFTSVASDIYIPPTIVMMEMIAGAGKTYFIQYAAKKKQLVLTARKDAVGELVSAFSSRGISPKMITVLTADSYILNGFQQYEIVHIDEATMLHMGGIAVVCQKARPKVLVMYGDKEQISYVVRDSFSTAAFKLIPDTVPRFYSSVTRRTTADACALNAGVYGRHIWTTNSRMRGLDIKEMKSKDFTKIPLIKGAHYICFTNPDVSMLKAYFKKVKFQDYSMEEIPAVVKNHGEPVVTTVKKRIESVTTAHVAEGGTWDHVVIVRPTNVAYTTYDMNSHLLVATTRHRISCTYFSAKPGDKLWKKIAKVKSMSDEELRTFMLPREEQEKSIFIDGIECKQSILEHPVYKIMEGATIESVL